MILLVAASRDEPSRLGSRDRARSVDDEFEFEFFPEHPEPAGDDRSRWRPREGPDPRLAHRRPRSTPSHVVVRRRIRGGRSALILLVILIAVLTTGSGGGDRQQQQLPGADHADRVQLAANRGRPRSRPEWQPDRSRQEDRDREARRARAAGGRSGHAATGATGTSDPEFGPGAGACRTRPPAPRASGTP